MLGYEIVEEFFQNPTSLALQVQKDGYDLVIEHPKLPVEVVAIGSPKIFGHLGRIKVRFLVKIEAKTLRLLCRKSAGDTLPAKFRENPVVISIG